LYLSQDDLNELVTRVRDYRPFLASYAANPSLQNFFGLINSEADHAMMSNMVGSFLGGDDANKSGPSQSKLDLTLVNSMLEGMIGERRSPWDNLTSVGPQASVLRDGYLASDNGKYLLMNVVPADGRDDGPNPIDA